MSSIVGESKYRNAVITRKPWHNATTADIATIDAQITSKTAELQNASNLLTQALNGIALCNNSAWGCVSKSGRHISTWREQRDTNSALVTRYKAELAALQEQRASYVAEVNASLMLNQQMATVSAATAAADKAIAEASKVQATATASKIGVYLLIGGGLIALVIGGIYIYKKVKK